jgi:hypothetical protein
MANEIMVPLDFLCNSSPSRNMNFWWCESERLGALNLLTASMPTWALPMLPGHPKVVGWTHRATGRKAAADLLNIRKEAVMDMLYRDGAIVT